MQYVIIGNGVAGITAAETIRQCDPEGGISLIENDILVVDTGCAAVATAKAGLKTADAARFAGPGLREVCTALGVPPVLHMGSTGDNVRILLVAAALANALHTDISDLPLAGAAPEWYSEKAVSIGAYFVAAGVYTVLGPIADRGTRRGGGGDLRGGAGSGKGRRFDPSPHRKPACEAGAPGTGGLMQEKGRRRKAHGRRRNDRKV